MPFYGQWASSARQINGAMKEGERERERKGAGVPARARACGGLGGESEKRQWAGKSSTAGDLCLRLASGDKYSISLLPSLRTRPPLRHPPSLSRSLALLKSTVSLLTCVSRAVEFADAFARKVVRAVSRD